MDGWRQTRFADFLSVQRGHDLPEQNRVAGDVPILGSFGITGWHNQARAKGPGITIGRSGASFGTVAMSVIDFWPLNTALYVTDFKGNDVRFCYYLLKTIDFAGYNSGSAQPSLNRNFIADIPLFVPAPHEQRAIAGVLGALDEKIEANRRMNATLEAIARALFKSWFVDFDPVRAKMEGRTPALAPDLAALFPARLTDSPLGPIPEGWEMRALGTLTSKLRRGIGPSYVETGGVRVLNQKCIRDRVLDFTPSRRHDAEVRNVDERLLKVGDVLVNSTGVGTLGRVAQLRRLDEPTIVDSHVTVVRADPSQISALLLGIDLTGREREIEALGEGSTGQTELSRVRLAEMDVLRPSRTVQKLFEDFAQPIVSRISSSQQQSRTLAQLRDLLLPKLLSGALRLRDAERMIGDAA